MITEHIHKPSDIPEQLLDILTNPPEDWDDPNVRIIATLFCQSGILPNMAKNNAELLPTVLNFFTGKKGILVVGGESGMGKSLIAADLRRMHQELLKIMPAEWNLKLAVISWDRTHKAFFDEVSTEIGETVEPPKGQTHVSGREIVSKVLADQIVFLRKYCQTQLILVETPLINIRGERLFDELPVYRQEMQTLIMHSPRCRYETLMKGRLVSTSGQPDSMESIREELLFSITGQILHVSPEEQDEIIRQWWIQQCVAWNGLVVDWDPENNRQGFTDSVTTYQNLGIKPDILTPKGMSRFTQRQYESILQVLPNASTLIQTIASSR